MEAENFRELQDFEVEYGDRRTSQQLKVRLSKSTTSRLHTTFKEPYTATRATYGVQVRYLDESDGQAIFRLRVNGRQQGVDWKASRDDDSWRTRNIPDVIIADGDDIEIEVQGHSEEYGELDYLQLELRDSFSSP